MSDLDDLGDTLPPRIAPRSLWASWILLAAAGIVIFLVGVTLGDLAHRTPAARVTATVTAVVAVPGPTSGVNSAAVGAQFGDGVYQVGVEIGPGNYHTDGGKNCYWERLSDLHGGFSGIIANGEPTVPTTVRVFASDRGFGVHGGCLWTLIG